MFKYLFLFAPCLLLFFCCLVVLFRKHKTHNDLVLLGLCDIAMLYFLADAAYISPDLFSRWMIPMDILGKLTSLTLIPFLYYFHRDMFGKPISPRFSLIFSLPILMAAACTLIYGFSGWERGMDLVRIRYSCANPEALVYNNYQAQYFFCLVIYNTTLIVESIMLLFYCGVWSYRMHRNKMRDTHETFQMRITDSIIVLMLVIIVRVCLSNYFLYQHPVIACIVCAVITLVIFTFFANVSFDNMWQDQKNLRKEMTESLSLRANQSLQSRFERLMLAQGKCFEASITIEEIAHMLNSNRTTLSKLIRQVYDMDFPTWVNTQRIEKAKTLLLDPMNLKQETIAEQCGYTEASVLNRKFKQLTGLTPKAWLYSQKK